MTITLVLPQPPAYSETFFQSKIRGLKKSGYEVVIVTASTKLRYAYCKHLQHPKVVKNTFEQVFRMLLVFVGLLPYSKRVVKYVQLEQKEQTHWIRILEKIYLNATLLKLKTHWLHFGYATMAIDRELVAKAIGAKMGVSFRGSDIMVYPLKHRYCFNKLWKHVDKVHSNSHFLHQKALTMGLNKAKAYQIITPAVHIENRPPLTKIKANTLQLVTVARLHWVKGIDDVIATAHQLKQSQIKFKWNIIGDVQTKDVARYLYHVYQLGLADEVVFLGKQSHQETKQGIQQADIYVQTSLSEGFCNAVLEAQALGKLCIAFNVGALSENIVDNETGFLVAKHRIDLLADKILAVSKLPDDQKTQIQNKAMLRVKNEFGLEKQRKEFEEFYIC